MSKNTIISIIIGVVILLVAGYMLFFQQPASSAVTATEASSEAEVTFVNLAAQLEPLGFDTSILANPRFLELVDIHTIVLPEVSGRKDPFAPLPK